MDKTFNPKFTALVRFPVELTNFQWLKTAAEAEGKPLGILLNEVLTQVRVSDKPQTNG